MWRPFSCLPRHRLYHGSGIILTAILFWLGQSLWSEERFILKITSTTPKTKSASDRDNNEVQKTTPTSTISKSHSNSKQEQDAQQHPKFSQFEHFLVHTPKSGGSYAFDMLIELLQENPSFQRLPEENQFMVCDGRTRFTKDFEKYFPLTGQVKSRRTSSSTFSLRRHRKYNVPCTLWMAEQPHTTMAKHNYIILRDPRSHILSQYFHCKESINHYDRWKYMPSLTEWLHAWTQAIHNETLAQQYTKEFRCFDPRNMQTRFAGWKKDDHDPQEESLVETLLSLSSSSQNHLIEELQKKNEENRITHALKSQFVVVGDNHRMWESICTIFIRYTSWVPSECDCSSVAFSKEEHEEIQHANNDQDDHHNHRQLKIHFYGHGVQHHGNSFLTTSEQDEYLTQLMTTDEPLYRIGQEVFEEQKQEVEKEYGIQLCLKKPK